MNTEKIQAARGKCIDAIHHANEFTPLNFDESVKSALDAYLDEVLGVIEQSVKSKVRYDSLSQSPADDFGAGLETASEIINSFRSK